MDLRPIISWRKKRERGWGGRNREKGKQIVFGIGESEGLIKKREGEG